MSELPSTYKAWRRTTGKEPLTIELTTEQTPKPEDLGNHDVLMKIHAVSLNYRDVAMLHGKYVKPVEKHGISGSDCAAEVVAVGADVTNFKKGDRVSAIYDLNNKNADDKGDLAALGGERPGVLREYAVLGDDVLVRIPSHLSWEEGSILTSAGLTAWTSLRLPGFANRGNTALLQGTGGVSMFALVLCLATGIYPIITSSSDGKLYNVCKLAAPGKIGTINYKKQDVKTEVLRLTEGKGVDVVVNNIGAASVNQDVAILRRRGVLSLVGFLAGSSANLDPNLVTQIIVKCVHIVGIYVGSIMEFREMNKLLDWKKIQLHPLINRVFDFRDTKEAFDYLYSGTHVGKVIVKV